MAPLQFWVNAVCGAPARVALASPKTFWWVEYPGRTELVFADKSQTDALAHELEEQPKRGEMTEIGFASKPVSFTAAIAAAVLFGLSQVV